MASNFHLGVRPHTLDRILIKACHYAMGVCACMCILFIAMQLTSKAQANTSIQAVKVFEVIQDSKEPSKIVKK